jgi:tetratricopeptide (TPR) repeat protein
LPRIARAKQMLAAAFPADHWMLAGAVVVEAEALRERGDYDDAVVRAHAGLAALEAALGSEHHFVGVTHCVLGTTELARERHQAALDELERCVETFERVLPSDHVELGDALAELGRAELLAGDVAAARDHLRRGLAIAEARRVHDTRLARMRGDLHDAEATDGRAAATAQAASR